MIKPTPAGQQPPGANWFPILLRLVWLGNLVLLWYAERLRLWAMDAQEDAYWARGDMWASTLGQLAGVVLPVVSSPWLARVALSGAVLLVGELALAAAVLVWAQLRAPRPDGTYLRIRAPRGSTPRSSGMSGRAPGEDLFQALHGLFPAGSPVRLTCLLSGRPDQPSELGIHLAGGSPDQHAAAVAAVRKLVLGQLPDAVVDERPDALAQALTPGAWLAWREVGLRRPPHEPLRFGDEATRSDLLGPLAAALQPPVGVTHTEAHLVLRPRRDWELTEGWRRAGLRRLLHLKAKRLYSVADEAARLEQKLDSPAFDVSIRLVVVAADSRQAATTALDQLISAIGQYGARSGSGAQGLRVIRGGRTLRLPTDERAVPRHRAARRLRARPPRVAPSPALLWPVRFWQPAAILTPEEIRGLWHLPTPGLAQLIQPLPCRFLPPPDIAFIPPGASDRITIGTAAHADGRREPVGPGLFDLNQVLHTSGGMGAGKSRLFANVIEQIRSHGLTYYEGKPSDKDNLLQFARKLLDREDEARLAIIDPLDVAWPVGLNPLAGVDMAAPDGADRALGMLDSVLARLDPETWSHAPGMQQYLQMSVLAVMPAERTATVAHMKQLLLDEQYRARLLPRCGNLEVRTFWEVTYPLTAAQQKASRDALLRRFDQLLVPELTRHMVTSSTFHFTQAMARQWIVLVSVPTDRLGNLARALAMLLFQQFVLSAFERGGTALSRAPYPLLLDEFQELVANAATDDLKRALAQLRSLGIPALYANQALSQIGDLLDLLLTNAQNRVVPRIIGPDAQTYARHFANAGITAADISGQEPDHQYADFLVGGRPTGLFSMQPLPWPTPRTVEVPPAPPRRWQTALPDQADPIDPWLARLVYSRLPNPGAAAAALARADAATWAHIQERWAALRDTHRQLILAHPGLVPERMERQRWLSRLLIAQPRILAAATYQRQRWEVAPEEPPTRVAPAPSRPPRPAPSEHATTPDVPGLVEPVTGATPDPQNRPAAPASAERTTADDLLRQRGSRRPRSEIAPGFDDLDTEEFYDEG